MPDALLVESIHKKFIAIIAHLDERASRRWAAAEALSLGRGGITAVSAATGISDRTIRRGIKEIRSQEQLDSGRQRRPGAGRKSRESEQPGLIKALERLVESGMPEEQAVPVKSTRNLAAELRRQGFEVSSTKVGSLLKSKGYTLQSKRRIRDGG